MPVSPDDFRRIALSFPDTEERHHMKHQDFRVDGKIFATLGYPDNSCGMVRLTPEYQDEFTRHAPKAFVPVKGTWGKQGCTTVVLKAVTKASLKNALELAWRTRRQK